jgi:hypothetical protein
LASDQTPQRYKDLVPQGHLGTGVFLQIAASGGTMVTFEQNLSYELCAQRGDEFAAFKWVPLPIASYAAVVGSRCRLVGELCADSCDADGCLCNSARKQCVDASGNSLVPPHTGSVTSGDFGETPAVIEIAGSYSRR